jgi:hypothetical protein
MLLLKVYALLPSTVREHALGQRLKVPHLGLGQSWQPDLRASSDVQREASILVCHL